MGYPVFVFRLSPSASHTSFFRKSTNRPLLSITGIRCPKTPPILSGILFRFREQFFPGDIRTIRRSVRVSFTHQDLIHKTSVFQIDETKQSSISVRLRYILLQSNLFPFHQTRIEIGSLSPETFDLSTRIDRFRSIDTYIADLPSIFKLYRIAIHRSRHSIQDLFRSSFVLPDSARKQPCSGFGQHPEAHKKKKHTRDTQQNRPFPGKHRRKLAFH